MTMRAASALTLALTACAFRPTGGQPADDGGADASDADAPTTDAATDAPVDATGTMADACTPVCGTDEIVSCGAVVESCPAGCSTTGSVHCKQLVPSNGVSAEQDLAGVDGALTLMADRLYVLDTDTGEIRHFPLDGSGGGAPLRAAGIAGLDPVTRIRWRTATQPQPQVSAPPPELAIFGVDSLTIPDGAVLRPIGGRAAVLVARGVVTIAGELDVGGGRVQAAQGAVSLTVPGPGGGRGADGDLLPARGCAPGGNGTRQILGGGQNRDTGGGGGGLGTAGGHGGPASLAADGGGVAAPQPLLPVRCSQTGLMPLRGGSGGGSSRDAGGGDVSRGGGGGGAVQLTSFTSITLTDGSIYAGGAGGAGDGEAPGSADGGGAGGSGGGILLEAPTISIMAGSITATGGAGGAGNGNTSAGQSGQRSGEAAQPTGNGGRGATGGELPAQDGTGDIDGTGGGGGGAGLVHLRTVRPPAITGVAILRPTPSASTATTTD